VTVTVGQPPQPIAGSFSYSGPPPCYADGNPCDICLDDHISNPVGLYYTVSTSASSQQGGTLVLGALNGCVNNVTYTSPNPSNTGTPVDTFTYTVTDAYLRPSTGTVSVTIDFATGRPHF